MTVYIESVFANNFVFDFILLLCVKKIARLKVTKLRLVSATFFGTAVAVFLPLLNLGSFALVAKLCLSVGIVFVLGGYKTKKQFFANLLLFWGLTFGMGGTLVGIYFLTKQDFALQQDLSVVSNSPLILFAGGLLVFGFVAKNLAAYVNSKKTNVTFEYDVEITVKNKKFVAKGFLDSGNQLCDTATGLPVVITTSKQSHLFFSALLAESVSSKQPLLKDPRYIRVSTLTGNKKMLVFGVDKFVADGKERAVLIGLGDKTCCFDCDLLLNAKMF
ncbi:MAG: sigma-E processing peptidase SpoIIGA [Clostridia bacterium]|nr:sigma-E processing peptidase SpoIIGA [Clostridia bacterium]